MAGMMPGMDRFNLFATPLVVIDLPGVEKLNAELSERLLAEEKANRGVTRSNVGGWHSIPDLSRRPEPCYQTVMQAIVENVGGFVAGLAEAAGTPNRRCRFALQGWAMVMRDGDYTVLHDHGEAHFSTVYYIDPGDEPAEFPQSGRIGFVDPRRAGRPVANMDLFPSTFSVKPRAGALIIFPGWLQHFVHTYRGTKPRICVSVNVVMEPQP
jgi:uncharacterized protein (TIGR02466 family)